jgi:hypothetical protein
MYPPGYPQMPYDPNMQWQGQVPPYGVQSGTGYPPVPYPGMPDPQAMAQAQAQAQGQMPQFPTPAPVEAPPAQAASTTSAPMNPLEVEDDPFTQHISDFDSDDKSPDSLSLPSSPLDKDEDPFASVAKSSNDEIDSFGLAGLYLTSIFLSLGKRTAIGPII